MNWDGKRIVVIGAARQGLALTRYLAEQGARVVLTDARSAEELGEVRKALADLDVTWELGGHPFSLLDDADLVCPSGGVPLTIPLVQEAIWRGVPLSNDSQIFVDAAPCTIVGITGSAGKTTTTTLMGRIAEQAAKAGLYRRALVGGNIGFPLVTRLDEIAADDLAVVEFSSFQLELMTTSPQAAAILNISPNHLDRHCTMEVYRDLKADPGWNPGRIYPRGAGLGAECSGRAGSPAGRRDRPARSAQSPQRAGGLHARRGPWPAG